MTCNHIPSVTCPECAGADRDKFYIYQPTCPSCRSLVKEVARLTLERDEARKDRDHARDSITAAWQRYMMATEEMMSLLRPGVLPWRERAK